MQHPAIHRVLGGISALAFALAFGAALAGQGKEPDTIVLKGAPMGAVKFAHKAHTASYGAKCESCHHAAKSEKPAKTPQQACTDCHTKAVAPPMKTNTRAAFHDPMAKAGTCIDCHQQTAAKGKKPPLKCNECHKKENG
ncbi:MAG TPA: cytochrome c3 family protein [Vicinamibacterales bacterium]|nr:cytochrome c3 family protein [Vicinamibacterales bacterium]